MKRKCVMIGIILISVMMSIVPAIAKQPLSVAKPQPSGIFFGMQCNYDVTWDENQTKEPIIPQGELRHIVLNITYWFTRGLFGRLINYLFSGEYVIMKLQVTNEPSWSHAIISSTSFSLYIPPKENINQIWHDDFTIQVSDEAPAFELFNVTIQATIEPLYGHFGLFPWIQGPTHTYNLTFQPGYKPLISPQLPQGNKIETPPLVTVQLPIGIKNLGNGKTIVENELVHYPPDWTVTIPPQIILEVGEYKEFTLNITAPMDFSGEEVIRLLFTPHYYYNSSLIGSSISETIIAYYNSL